MQPHRRIDVRRVLYRGKNAIYGRYCPRIGGPTIGTGVLFFSFNANDRDDDSSGA